MSLGSSVTPVISHKKINYIGPIHLQFSSSLPVALVLFKTNQNVDLINGLFFFISHHKLTEFVYLFPEYRNYLHGSAAFAFK